MVRDEIDLYRLGGVWLFVLLGKVIGETCEVV